ncbi:MAG: SDR family NAD(P)-dependent oxidoreductase [Austwickia sp.]|jgi:SDR family mycofactocin-dependent oxidoreductase|nr:SDR family NAD(P)-dependent oxidoreductase [Austwickia sp.]MBK8437888.1 SDR family NAD(P)-dependent oxidoreductase [Austwickia sp.]MBK9100189.1 SDR family NAD(P)-dependent oxidoreductase [Austwickia sp.]
MSTWIDPPDAQGRVPAPLLRVDDRYVALVTGAARGLGAAVCSRFVQRGLQVIAVDHCVGDESDSGYAHAAPADLERLSERLGDSIRPVMLDVRDAPALEQALVQRLRPQEHLVTVVAAAATIEGGAYLWESDPAVLDRLWQSNVCTVWSTATATVPQLLRTAHAGIPASFVAVASLAGHTGLYHLSAYCAVKHAVVGLIRGLAADLVNQGVYVSAVSPDAMATAMLDATASLYGLDSVDALVADMECRAPLSPDDVAAMVEFACANGPTVHGTAIRATGGLGM